MTFAPVYGLAETVAAAVVRVVAPNPGPFTGAGTNTYLLGTHRLVVVDPGLDDAAHRDALVAAVAGRPVSHILLTHTHRDHADGVAALRAAVGGAVLAAGPARPSRPVRPGEEGWGAAHDLAFAPDATLADGDTVDNGDVAVRAVATPGHTANHLAFDVGDTLLSGDHVMGWSTTVVAPPDGDMAAYMASLDRLAALAHRRYLPGHGDVIDEPGRTVSATRSHRLMRERAIRERLALGDRTVAAIVAALYAGLDPRLARAAGLSVSAHLEKLLGEGRVSADGTGAEALWRPV